MSFAFPPSTLRSRAIRRLLAPLVLAASALLPCVPAQAATPVPASAPTQTRHPIVLVHGLFGFKQVLGLDYFYGIPQALRAGGATVYIAQVSQVNDNDVRGEQLLRQLRQWAAAGGHEKFNLIGHSQGGPTARYVAGVAPSLVASVTTVASPHVLAQGGSRDGALGALLNDAPAVAEALGRVIAWLSGTAQAPQDVEALKAWAADTAAFNARFPLGAPTTPCGSGPELAGGVRFYSITGIGVKTNAWDITDLVVGDLGAPSDGVVTQCAAAWGKVIRNDYPWNHFDEVNQAFGLIGKGAPDPVAFYRSHAGRLKLLGL